MAEEDRRSDLAVMDANDYKQKRRLQRILDAHDRVEDTANKLFEMYASGEISSEARAVGIQHAVKQFIRECQNLLPDDGSELSHDAPDPWEQKLGEVPMRSRSNVAIAGLDEFLQTRESYHESWAETVESKHGPGKMKTKRASHTVPKHVSWSAYTLLWEFLHAEYDIDVQFEDLDDSLPSWGYDEVDADDVPNVDSNGHDDGGEADDVEVAIL